VDCHNSPSGQSAKISIRFSRPLCLSPPAIGLTTTITSSRSIAATSTFCLTAALTARFLHGGLAPIPGDLSLGAHGGAFLVSGFAALASTLAASRVISAGVRARQAVAFCSAFAFALSLRLSNLSDPRRVLAFLLTPAHTAFDPSLIYLAVGAIPLAAVLYRVGRVRVQRKKTVDARLLAGAALFGVGWGIEGLCRKSLSRPSDHPAVLPPPRLPLTTITVAGPALVNFGWSLATSAGIRPLATWLAAVIIGGFLAPP
jgi:uncharacterized protein